MADSVQDQAPPRTPEAQEWVDENLVEQEARYRLIEQEMIDLEPERAKWYAEFLEIVATKGWNTHIDNRAVVPRDKLPQQNGRKDRVIW